MRWQRWTLALVITLMMIDAWMPGAAARVPGREVGASADPPPSPP